MYKSVICENKASVVENEIGNVIGFYYPLDVKPNIEYRFFRRDNGKTTIFTTLEEGIEWLHQ